MNGARRGFFGDSIYLIILFFVISIFFVVAFFVANEINNATSGTLLGSQMGNASNGILGFDMIVPLFVIGMGAALIISAFLIRTMPVFFIFFLIVNVILAYASTLMSNAWYQIFTGNALSASAGQFTSLTAVFKYLPFVSIVLGVVFAIALFMKGGE